MAKELKVFLPAAIAMAILFFLFCCTEVRAVPPPPGFPSVPQFPQPPSFPSPPVPPPFPSPAPPFPAPYPPTTTRRVPNFGVSVLASDLPTPSHLRIMGPLLFWSQAGDSPVEKMSITGGEPEPIAMKIGVPENIVVSGKQIFWIDGDRLKATDTDGETTTVISTGKRHFGDPAPIATDGKHVYWVNSQLSRAKWTINSVPASGGESTVIATASNQVVSLSYDNGYVYWEEMGAGPRVEDGSNDSAIRKVPATGGQATTIVDGGLNGLMPPIVAGKPSPVWRPAGGIAVSNGSVYFSRTNYLKETDKLLKVSTGGGPVAIIRGLSAAAVKIAADGGSVYWTDSRSINMLPAGGGAAVTLAGGLHSPADIAVGPKDVYWTETVCCGHGQTGSIKEVPKAGGKITALAEGVDAPGPIAIGGGEVFWGEGGPAGLAEGFGRIAKVSSDGVVTTVASGISSDRAPIAVDNLNVYVADKFTIKRIPLSGGQAEKIAGGDFTVVDLAADTQNVYWIEDPVSTVREVSVNGGPVTTLTSGNGPAGRIAVDGSNIYWVDHYDTIRSIGIGIANRFENVIASNLQYVTDLAVSGGSVFFLESNGRDIKSAPVSGGFAGQLVGFLSPPGSIAVDRTNLYWADQSGVGEVPRGGGAPAVVATGLASDPLTPNSIATDGAYIYWTEAGGGFIKRAPR